MKRLIAFLILFSAVTAMAQIQVTTVKEQDELKRDSLVVWNEFWEGSWWTWRLDPDAEPRTNWERHRDLGQTFTAPKSFWLDKLYVEPGSSANTQAAFDSCESRPVHVDIYEFDPEAAIPDSRVPPIDTLTSQPAILPAVLDSAAIADYGLGVLLEFDISDVYLEEGKFYGFLLKFDELYPNQRLQMEKTHGQYDGGTMLVVYFDGSNGRENVPEFQWSHGGHGNNPVRDLRFFLIETANPGTVVNLKPEIDALPDEFELAQNYPNPFNPETMISFSVAETKEVRLDVFSVDGRLVNTLYNQSAHPGSYEVSWDGTDHAGARVSSGVYFYRLTAGNHTLTRKMMLLQ